MRGGSLPVPLETRFWKRVDKDGPIPSERPDLGKCWTWTGYRSTSGYGMIWMDRKKAVMAHRLSYEWHVGPIPRGLTIDHLCRNRGCVNPGHLEPVTRRENILRGVSPSAVGARKTCCPKGHPYSPENTYIRNDAQRACRECHRIRGRQEDPARRHAKYLRLKLAALAARPEG